MTVLNCLCGARLDGADDEALVRALRWHSDEAHAEIGLSDEMIRGLVARAGQMTAWDGQATPVRGPVETRPLTPERADDFLAFFDRDAFMDNPIWASCYCLFYQFAGSTDAWQRRGAAENRAAKAELIRAGKAHGYLAYVDGRPAGWCHAAPRATLPGLDRNKEFRTDDPEVIGAIVCFVIAAPYRRQGIASRLLDAACQGLRAQGMAVAQAYPAKEVRSEANAYHGPLAMYLAAGFTPVREAGDFVVVRRALSDRTSD
jgi:GNAT superfamily N-acetyltransferase